jgi:hypothetical protein
MSRLTVASLGALTLGVTAAWAEPIYLSGTVGKAPVLVTVERKGADVFGWYLYLRHGKQLRLEGKVQPNGALTLREYSPGGSVVTAHFTGTVRGAQWTGTRKAMIGGAPVTFALTENRDTLAGVNGSFACSARQVDGELGWVWTESMNLTVAHGNVTRLNVSHSARSLGNDEQMCGIAHTDLERASSATGILLRAKGDTPGGEGGHCSVRVVAVGDYIYLAVGDSKEDGNDCRSSGDTMYCSPRGNWNDLVLDRTTGQCTMVR